MEPMALTRIEAAQFAASWSDLRTAVEAAETEQ